MKNTEPKIRVAHRDTRQWEPIDSFTTTDVWEDGWIGMSGGMTITPPNWACSVRIVGNKLTHPEHLRLLVAVNGVEVRREILAIGHFVVDLPHRQGAGTLNLTFSADSSYVPAEVGINGEDLRNLSWILVAVQAAR
jgi:hypothetical protein